MSYKKSEIQERLFELIENKASIKHIKNAAVAAKNFELAAEIREIEVKMSPKRNSSSEEMKDASLMKSALAAANLDVDTETAFVIHRISQLIHEKGGGLDIRSIAEIEVLREEVFGY